MTSSGLCDFKWTSMPLALRFTAITGRYNAKPDVTRHFMLQRRTCL